VDAEFIDYVLSMFATLGLTYAILRFDEARLSEEQLERAWPPSSRNAAVLAFSPICLIVHFIKTRWSLIGVLLGLGAALFVVGINYLLTLGVDAFVSP
jgi:protein-S-isoprenylcysteine O-methyltransferase Ste14